MSSALALVGLRHRFGNTLALDGVDLELHGGEVHALLGQNGAGKSTLVRCAMGLLHPDEGAVRVDGRPVRLGGPRDLARSLDSRQDSADRGNSMVSSNLAS